MIRKPTSMVGAMSRVEEASLAKPGGGDYRAEIKREYIESLKSQPDEVNRRIAVDYLLRWVYAIDVRGESKSRGEQIGQSYFQTDPDNLIVRLAYATLLDAKNGERPPPDFGELNSTSRPADVDELRGAAMSAPDRYRAMREIMDGTPAANDTLYNSSLIQVWTSVVRGYVERPDVAATIGLRPPSDTLREYRVGPVDVQCEVLPLIERRIEALASALESEGHDAEAAECRGWMARTCLGLLLSESHIPTKFYCADVVARFSRKSAPTVAESLVELRRDYQREAEKGPVDYCDQRYTMNFSVAPVEYERALGFLGASVAAWVAAAGAAAALVATLIVGPVAIGIRRWRKRATAATPSVLGGAFLRRSPAFTIVAPVVPVAVVAAVLLVRIIVDQYFSIPGAITLLLLAAALGASISIWLGAVRTTPNKLGQMATAIVMAGFVMAMFLPMSSLAWFGRSYAIAVGSEWLLLPLFVALVSTGAVVCGASIRTLISSTAITWCVLSCFALVLYIVHFGFDRQYQSAAVAGHADEIAARLGADWQKQYLSGAIEYYHPPRP